MKLSPILKPQPLSLPSIACGRVVAHAIAIYPNEACGILVGIDEPSRRVVVDAIAIDNVWQDQSQLHNRFTIDPKRQIEIEKSLEGTEKSVVGFYHTHPDHPAEPSAFDLEAAWAFYSYLIVRVSQNRVEQMRSWLLDESHNQFVEQPVEQSNG